MSHFFYSIPLQLSKAMEGNELPTCGLTESINKNLELIIMTRFGEHRSDPTFGCEIWDLDFELIVSESLWSEKLRKSLLKSIVGHELRLTGINILVSITDVERHAGLQPFTEIKKQVTIQITAIVHKTGEKFSFNTRLFLSPLSKG